MKVSINWIKDFVNLDGISNDELINRFTLSTAEIEGATVEGDLMNKVKIVEITAVEKHPDAEKLNLVSFNTSEDECLRVVCGAKNVGVGKKVPFAPIGTSFPSGLILTPKKIRGVISEGMLCSGEELGLEDSSDGLYILEEDAPVGQTLGDFFGVSRDLILDIDNKSLTHRPDLWGHFGMAREFSAIFNRELCASGHDKKEIVPDIPEIPMNVKVHPSSCAKAYWGLSIKNIKVRPSSTIIQSRLKASGINPKNNIVDISNYVMLELGIPNHIFDLDKLSGNLIEIKEIGSDLEFITLDEQKRALVSTDTVVSDKSGPLVIAGIMGGQKSAVSEDTQNLFIEVANWDASRVRQTSTRLGLRTDSSQRYEKSLDNALTLKTLVRLTELIKQECPDSVICGQPVYDGQNINEQPSLKIKTDTDKINSVLGVNLSPEKMVSIFESLDFKVCDLDNNTFIVNVPSFRATKDIECEADLIEEIGRIIGYDNIEPVAPNCVVRPAKVNIVKSLHRKIRNFLIYSGNFNEIMTYPLVGKKLFSQANIKVGELELINSLSEEASFMRPSMLPSILEHINLNNKHYEDFSFFEIGKIYNHCPKKFADESNQLIFGKFTKSAHNPFLDVVNVAEKLLSFLNLPYQLQKPLEKYPSPVYPTNWFGVHPIEKYDLKIMGRVCGSVFSVHPITLKSFKIRGQLSLVILDISQFEQSKLKAKFSYKKISKFPRANFDCTVDVDSKVSVGDILRPLSKIKSNVFRGATIRDIFTKGDRKYVTISNDFSHPDRTLDGDEIKSLETEIVNKLGENKFFLKK